MQRHENPYNIGVKCKKEEKKNYLHASMDRKVNEKKMYKISEKAFNTKVIKK